MRPAPHGSYSGADGPTRRPEPPEQVERRPKPTCGGRGSSARPRAAIRHCERSGPLDPLPAAAPAARSVEGTARQTALVRFGRVAAKNPIVFRHKGTPGRPGQHRGSADRASATAEFLSRRRAVGPPGSAARTPRKTAAVFYVCAGPKIRSGVGRAPPRRLFGGPHGPSTRISGGFSKIGWPRAGR